MKNLFNPLLILLVTGLVSCSHKPDKQVIPHVQCSEAEDLVFTLDDSTVENMNHLQYFQRNDSDILAFTNEYDNSIVFYNYKDRKYLDRICYDKEGSNGIGSVFSFCYVSPDSIYHYHYNLRTLFRTDSNGKVMEKHLLQVLPNPSPDSLFLAPVLFPRIQSPMRLIGEEILIPGFLMAEVEGENEKNRPVMTYFHLTTHHIRHSDSYPSMYHGTGWGGDFNWRAIGYTLSPDSELVLSFPADHRIRVHKPDEEDYREYDASVGNDYPLEPLKANIKHHRPLSPDEINSHYVKNLTYGGIYFDKYRNVYYRIAKLPDSQIDIHKRPIRKPIAIVVLDKDFHTIGKASLPAYNYYINNTFVGEEGLHIQVQSDDEDKLVFKTFLFD